MEEKNECRPGYPMGRRPVALRDLVPVPIYRARGLYGFHIRSMDEVPLLFANSPLYIFSVVRKREKGL